MNGIVIFLKKNRRQGHTSGGSRLSSAYRGVPRDWIEGGGPIISWLPSGEPSWSDLLLQLQRAQAQVGGAVVPSSSSGETRTSTEEGASFAGKQAVENEIPDNRPNA
jgi:hypothetical protein